MLQNDLPPRRRGELDIALAVIFMRSAGLDSGDLDADGDVDYFDARIVSDTATNLLAEIQRGNLTSAAEQSKGRAVAAAYFEHLDGLGYADVVELAGGQDTGPHVADMRRQMSQAACSAVAWKGDVRPPPLGNTSRIRRCD
jgi:hypothetical protein